MKRAVSFIFLIIITSSYLLAQDPEASFADLQNNEENVSVTPTFTINTNMSIDESSFKMAVEEKGADTTGKFNGSVWTENPDTLITGHPDAPNIFVITEEDYLNLPDSLWGYEANSGKAVIIDDTTIQFESWTLNYDSKYYAVIQNLKVVNSQNDTLECPIEVVGFSTQLPPFKFLTSNLGNGYFRCNDTLYFEFNRKIDSLTFYLGDLIEIKEVISKSYSNGEISEVLSNVMSTQWFSEDSTSIYVQPNNIIPDVQYYAKINLEYLSGDPLDNYSQQFNVAGYYQINISTLGVDYQLPPYYLDSLTVAVDDTITFQAFEYYDGKKFERWICPEDPTIDNSTSEFLTIVKNCSNLKDLTILAEYIDVGKDTVIVHSCIEGCGVVKVYDADGTYLGGAGQYLINAIPEEQLKVVYEPSDNYKFNHWISNVMDYNNRPDYMISIYGSFWKLIELDPYKEIQDADYSLTVIVKWENNIDSRYDPFHLIQNFVIATPTMTVFDIQNGLWMKTVIESDVPFFEMVSATVIPDKCDCYKLYAVRGDVTGTFESDYCNGGPVIPAWSEGVLVNDDDRHKTVEISVDRKLLTLEAELVVENARDLNNDRNLARIEVIPDYPENTTCAHIIGRREQHNRTDKKEYFRYSYKCHQDITVNTVYDPNYYEFKEYNSNPGFYGGATPQDPLMSISPMCESYDLAHAKKIQGVLADKFMLINIGAYLSEDGGAPSWTSDNPYNVLKKPSYNYEIATDDPNNVFCLDPTEETIILEFEFNRDVDQSTVNDQMNLKFEDISDRIDYPTKNGLNRKFYYYPNSIIGNYQWVGPRAIRCTLKTDDGTNIYGVPKFQTFTMQWTAGIQSTTGEPLSNPGKVKVLTEYPVAYFIAKDYKCKDDSEIDDYFLGVELLYHTFAVKFEKNAKSIEKGKYPVAGMYNAWNYQMINETWLNANDVFCTLDIKSHKNQADYYMRYGMNWYECDLGDIYDKSSEILNKYETEYNKPNGGSHAMVDRNLYNAMRGIAHPYRYNEIWLPWPLPNIRYISDDWLSGCPELLGEGNNFNSPKRWGTANGYNQIYDVIEINNQFLEVKIRYELR